MSDDRDERARELLRELVSSEDGTVRVGTLQQFARMCSAAHRPEFLRLERRPGGGYVVRWDEGAG